ncbi:MAG: NAD-dependent epimerase/dehydratase family protein [Leptospirales bacterium]|nr:NAD-dependent epimerase/dehydratase family protein [Leptospirales bacterium]
MGQRTKRSDRVLITGASGFVGRSIVPALWRAGFRLRLALRRPAEREYPADIEVVHCGPLEELRDGRALLRGCQQVLHLAAHVHVLDRDAASMESDFQRVNVHGLELLAQASIRSGVGRFTALSSLHAAASSSEVAIDERYPEHPDSAYGRSKLAADRILLRLQQKRRLPVAIVRPPMLYGTGGRGNLERLASLIERGLPLPLASIRNRRSVLYVENLASALVALLGATRFGSGVYLLRDAEDFSTPQLIRMLAAALQRPARLFPLPAPGLRTLGRAGDLLEKFSGRSIPFSNYAIRRLCDSLWVDDSRFRRQFGWQAPVATAEALIRSYAPNKYPPPV